MAMSWATDRASDPLRVVVVDDERLSRDRLRTLLEAEPDVTVVGECANGLEALTAITELHPELVFLDIQMPDLDGLGVLDALGCADQVACPEFVFVTAYNDYWERAFEVHAVDYLRKPYTTARFQSALAHGRRRVQARRAEQADAPPPLYVAALAALQSDRGDGRILVQDLRNASWHVLTAEEIDWIETDASARVRVHHGERSYQWRKSLQAIERALAGHGFLRVHRSHIVNAARIRQVKVRPKGEYTLLLHSGAAIDTGRKYRDVVMAFLEHTRAAALP